METARNRTTKQGGYVLVATLVLLLLLAVTAVTLNRTATLQAGMSANRVLGMQTYLSQAASIEQAIWSLQRDPNWRTGRYTGLTFDGVNRTVIASAGDFVADGFEPGDRIAIVGSAPPNDGFYTIELAAAQHLKLVEPLPSPGGGGMGQANTAAVSGGEYDYTDLVFLSGPDCDHDRITTASGDFLAAGFKRNDAVVVLNSFPGNDGIYTALDVTANTLSFENGALALAGAGAGRLAVLRGQRFDFGGVRCERRVWDRRVCDAGAFVGLSVATYQGLSAVTDTIRLPTHRNFSFADSLNHRIREVDPGADRIQTIAGNSDPATLQDPSGVWVDAAANVYIADSGNFVVRKRWAATAAVAVIAGTGERGDSGDGGPAVDAALDIARGVSVDGAGHVYIADTENDRVRKVDAFTGDITTVAGTGSEGYSGDGGPATSAEVKRPRSVCADNGGNLFLADTGNHRIRQVNAADGTITTVAGTGTGGYSGDAFPPTRCAFKEPARVQANAAGDLFVCDTKNHRIRKVNSGVNEELGFHFVTSVVGTGEGGYAGDGGPAAEARIKNPEDICFDAAGNLYIADTDNHRIRRVDALTGTITTVAGTGSAGTSGDNGLATLAQLDSPCGVHVDAAGNLWIADTDNHVVRRVNAATGIITRFAGKYIDVGDYSGDGDLATKAKLNGPKAVWADASGNVHVADTGNHRVRRIDAISGIITTVAGTGTGGFSGDGGPATLAQIRAPGGVVFTPGGDMLIADTDNHRLRKVSVGSGTMTTVAGNGTGGFSGDGGPATLAQIKKPAGVGLSAAGDLLIADLDNDRARRVEALTGTITTVAGNGESSYSGDAVPATQARLKEPSDVFRDPAGNLWIADTGNNRVRKVWAISGVITTEAGDGDGGFSGDGIPAVDTRLKAPLGVCLDSAGHLYIADTDNARIRRVDADTGIITTVAGTGGTGYSGDGGPATNATLRAPGDVFTDAQNNLYVADTDNRVIRKVYADTGNIGTIVGEISGGYLGDGVPATETQLNLPVGICRDASGNYYLADTENNRIRKVDGETGIISTIAGNGLAEYSGDGGPAVDAALNLPTAMFVDVDGNVFICDTENHRLRRVDAQTGIITTVAGTGSGGYSGDGGPAVLARLKLPAGLFVNAAGDILVADSDNHVIRAIEAETGLITTLAGTGGGGYDGDGGPATAAKLRNPGDVWGYDAGHVYIADTRNSVIRRVDALTGVITTVAGTGDNGYEGDGDPALEAELNEPGGLSLDLDGNIYISDTGNHCIRRVDAASGEIDTVAGKGEEPGLFGDGEEPHKAKLNGPRGIWVDQTLSGGGTVERP